MLAACKPPRCADIEMMREAVTTPVPPMPGMRMTVSPDQARFGGSGSDVGAAGYDWAVVASGSGSRAITKDGHSPLMQDMSRLQLPWCTAIFVPNSVSTWTSDMQVDCSAQSPQPSQTRLLIQTDSVSAGRWPRL